MKPNLLVDLILNQFQKDQAKKAEYKRLLKQNPDSIIIDSNSTLPVVIFNGHLSQSGDRLSSN